MSEIQEKSSWLDRSIFSFFPALTGEMLVFLLIIIMASVSRLYGLGTRVMSHDENLHTYFSWLFSIGQGYQHTPLMHGPLQFHLLALTFDFLGATDFTARLPAAIASILTIVLLWKWRRYLGKAGTIVAAVLMLISPYMLYYGRYVRNEAFIGVFFLLTLYSILRYLETGKKRYLVLLTIATVLHFTSKETAFIYTAQALLFLAVYLVNRVTRFEWRSNRYFNSFLVILAIGVIASAGVLGVTIFNRVNAATNASQTAAPIIPGEVSGAVASPVARVSFTLIFSAIAGLAFVTAAILLIIGFGWWNLRRERSFEMLILLSTFVLPQLAAFPVTALGWNPLDYQFVWPGFNLAKLWAQPPVRTLVVFAILSLASVGIGLLWNRKDWWKYAVIFWVVYIFFFTSVFTNWQGFFTGSVGSLGYWLQQQGVHRGDQPWYYYLLIQIPIYEFLPAIGLCLAAYLGFRKRTPALLPADELSTSATITNQNRIQRGSKDIAFADENKSEGNYTFPLLLWWAVSAILAYTIAGEKMPWLTVHITLPMILLSGWGLGQVIECLDWTKFQEKRVLLIGALFVFIFTSLGIALFSALGANPPFQGKSLDQLSATGSFTFSIMVALASALGIIYLRLRWKIQDIYRLGLLVFFSLLAILTIRAAVRAAYLHPNDATEYLVYAHGANGIQDVMDQISAISSRIAGEENLQVAYDNNLPNQGVSWSFKWYLRNYPNASSFNIPDDSLKDVPVIIVDQQNFEKIKPIVGTNYYQKNYIRMVWPNQDYFSLNWQRIKNALTNPAMRSAILQIWLDRDYSQYAQATGESGLTLDNWQPSARMELFIRKDIAAQMYQYGISQAAPLKADPYQKGTINLSSDLVFGTAGSGKGNLNTPRGLAVAPDGSIYVADSKNNRIEKFDPSGNLLLAFGQVSAGCPSANPPANLPLGSFCEPWAVAVSPDGKSVFVDDTWDHRIQKFTSDGHPVKAWGAPNYAPDSSGPFGLWGPRGIVVDSFGHVLVADTGNKRIVEYDAEGNFITSFGGTGVGTGQFDEPVGLALDANGRLFVADTWNQRIQVFSPNTDGTNYSPASQWTIAGWYSQSLDNKPYIAVDQLGHVFATDPDSFRVLEFTSSGQFVQAWGSYGTGPDQFGLPSGIAVDPLGRVWVSDSANDRLMQFTLP